MIDYLRDGLSTRIVVTGTIAGFENRGEKESRVEFSFMT
tara:strand:+ start:266 stop:382 length:117 start_codon:yes stop_codon:yes gene_type:complete